MGSLLFAKNVEAGLIKSTNNQLKKKQKTIKHAFSSLFMLLSVSF